MEQELQGILDAAIRTKENQRLDLHAALTLRYGERLQRLTYFPLTDMTEIVLRGEKTIRFDETGKALYVEWPGLGDE